MCFLKPCTGLIYFGDKVKLNNLESLYPSFNSLSGRIPPSLFTHPALSRLDLSRNQFSGDLGEFSNPSLTLTEVILSGNHLCGLVPKSFGWLASLESPSTVKIRQPSHEFTFGVGISFIPYPLVLTPVV
jgi:Leucine-rich repeat (LRR) protein